MNPLVFIWFFIFIQRITTLRNEHDVQLKAFKCQYEDECKKLQDELDLQRSKVRVYQDLL